MYMYVFTGGCHCLMDLSVPIAVLHCT